MHKDFHLFGTYLAAYNAGFSNNESKLIAFAAQAVDDFTEEVHVRHYSCQTNSQVTGSFSTISRKAMLDTWVPFHFLPSHINRSEVFSKNYKTGRPEVAGYPPSPHNAENYGELHKSVADNLCANYIQDNNSYLAKIGVTMHVLADTFAHQGFSGILSSENIAKDAYILMDTSQKIRLTLRGPMEHVPTYLAKMSNQFALGHGTIGHLPDISWAYYRFRIGNNSKEFSHENKSIFTDAFCYLSYLMSKMRNNTDGYIDRRSKLNTLLFEVYEQISAIYRGKYEIALTTDLDQTFATILRENCFEFDSEDITDPFKLNDEYYLYLGQLSKRITPNYNDFLDAVIWHRNFVEREILKHDPDYPDPLYKN